MIAVISIKVETESKEEEIIKSIKTFCIDNFQKNAEISVCGKEKTLYEK